VPLDQRQQTDRVARGRAGVAAALVAALVLVGCAVSGDVGEAGPASPVAPVDVPPPLPGELVLVLPPLEGLDPLEHARVRAGAVRALEEVLGTSRPARIVSAPTVGSVGEVVEQAARSADVVCVLGSAARASLESALLLYPRTIGCGLPAPTDGTIVLGVELDLAELGSQIGRAARAAAGTREVLVLSGGDALHGSNWAAGVSAGAAGGPVRILGSPDAVREELLRARGSTAGGAGQSRSTVGVVVLDASPGAADLARELLEQRVLLVAPRAFVADAPDVTSLVLRWRVRWDLPLTGLLRRAIAAADGVPPVVVPGPAATDGAFALEEGPAHVSSDADDVR
jgi:hypothetical protein